MNQCQVIPPTTHYGNMGQGVPPTSYGFNPATQAQGFHQMPHYGNQGFGYVVPTNYGYQLNPYGFQHLPISAGPSGQILSPGFYPHPLIGQPITIINNYNGNLQPTHTHTQPSKKFKMETIEILDPDLSKEFENDFM